MAEQEGSEHEIRAAFEGGDYERVTRLAFERYGDEVLAFLIARLGNVADGEEVFGSFAEKFWRGLPSFRWQASLRSWCYRIARNAANDFTTAAPRRRERPLTGSQHGALSALVERVRTQTEAYRRTEVKDRMQVLRETLPPDDQMLLILRVDREMQWRELALAMLEGSAAPADLDREAARLRKRFERVKDTLRELARRDGLL